MEIDGVAYMAGYMVWATRSYTARKMIIEWALGSTVVFICALESITDIIRSPAP